MKKYFIHVVVTVWVILSFSNPSFAQEYVVSGDFDYAPFSFVDKTGRPSGLDVEILEAIADLQDIRLKIKLTRWSTALSNLQSGQSDIIVGIIFSEEREKYFDFTIPIHSEHYSFFIRKDLPLDDLSSLFTYRLVVLWLFRSYCATHFGAYGATFQV